MRNTARDDLAEAGNNLVPVRCEIHTHRQSRLNSSRVYRKRKCRAFIGFVLSNIHITLMKKLKKEIGLSISPIKKKGGIKPIRRLLKIVMTLSIK
jgi:hypothetical protein